MLAVAFFMGMLVASNGFTPAMAQDATPVPVEEPESETSEVITDTVADMEVAAQAVLEKIEAADESLFVSLTTDDIDRAAMAVGQAHKIMVGREIPVTIFLNVEGVRLADKTIPQNIHATGESVQERLVNFMADGGTVLICPFCMKNVGGMTEDDVIDGVLPGAPELTWGAMFADNATTLSY